jgi:hypothetical protein
VRAWFLRITIVAGATYIKASTAHDALHVLHAFDRLDGFELGRQHHLGRREARLIFVRRPLHAPLARDRVKLDSKGDSCDLDVRLDCMPRSYCRSYLDSSDDLRHGCEGVGGADWAE